MYKLIALDMDGTLLRNDTTVSQRSKEAIKMAKGRGINITLTSGRPLVGIMDYLELLNLTGIDDYVVSFGGSIVQRVGTHEIIAKHVLLGSDLKACYYWAQSVGVDCQAFTDEGVIVPRINPYIAYENATMQLSVHKMDFNEVEDDTEIIKIMLVDATETIDRVVGLIPKAFHEKYTIVRSSPVILELLNKKSCKWYGVQVVMEHLGVNNKEVICIGDERNDIDMIISAGVGVAMGNAREEVKKHADFVTYDNEHDGVAYVIEKVLSNSF